MPKKLLLSMSTEISLTLEYINLMLVMWIKEKIGKM